MKCEREQLVKEPTGDKNTVTKVEMSEFKIKTLDKGYYFRDGIRRIDYVICREKAVKGKLDDDYEDDRKDELKRYRKKFMKKLKDLNMQIEKEKEEGEKLIVNFYKIHIPFELLCQKAEEFNFRVPLQLSKLTDKNYSSKIISFFHLPNIMENGIPYVPTQLSTAIFRREKTDKYLGFENEDTFFTVTQRHQIAYEILATQDYGRKYKGEIGIDRMVEEGIYSAAFPLHEGPFNIPQGLSDIRNMNRRQMLYEYWARWSKFYKYQPLDNIREYFGEKIALYFAWLGLYTTWLFPASAAGLIVFIYGLCTMNNYTPSREICESNMTYPMCPTCDTGVDCKIWYLSSVCFYAKVTYLFDNPGTVFFSVFMALWAVAFLETWKRKNATLSYRWDVLNYEEEEEKPRPQYVMLAPLKQKNPITGVEEPYFPLQTRNHRLVTGFICVLVMLLIVFIFIVGVIAYRILVIIPLSHNPLLRSTSLIFSSTTAAIVSLVLIMCLGRVYEQLAYKLTEWEMHRTETDYEDNLIIKVYLFQFVNYYSSIFYVAFFKGKLTGYPGKYTHLLGLRNEECSNGSCLFELAQQLAIIMVGKQVLNDAVEILLPKIKVWYINCSKGLNTTNQTSATDDSIRNCSSDYKALPYGGLFDEYLEMIIQFGFITIFVAAFPLAPLFALLNNLLEIRIDASKLVTETRRPVAERAQDIGTWFYILEFLVKLSIISNAFLITFTSDFIPRQVYKYTHNFDLTGYTNFSLSYSPPNSTTIPCRYRDFRDEKGHYTLYHWKIMAIKLGFVIVFEHVVFGISYLIQLAIPDIPEKLKIQIRKQNYKAKQALLDVKKIRRDDIKEEANIDL